MSDRLLYRCLAFFVACVAAVFLYAVLESALEIRQQTIVVVSLAAAGVVGIGYVSALICR
jgi:H2-forming N5,N10-methylenetetrahydromethanopterin dehydrogenase-like enzyme